MPSRPDIRDLVTNVKDAFADADRETLLEVLTFVVKEYVVEGPPPMLIHQAETVSHLQGMSFAQLISALQTRFDHAELAMFVVDGEQVGVRIGGVVHPLLPGRAPAAMPPGTQLVDTRPPPAQPGVRVVEATISAGAQPIGAPRPAPAQPPGQAPPPPGVSRADPAGGSVPLASRGLSIRGQPGAAPTAPAAPAQPPAQAAAPAAPAQAAPEPKPDKPEGSGDDASARFSLLELD